VASWILWGRGFVQIRLILFACIALVCVGCTRGLSAVPSARESWHPAKSDLQSEEHLAEPLNATAERSELSLSEAIDTALTNNPATQVAWRNSQAAAARRSEAASPLYPQLSGAASYGRSRNEVAQANLTREITAGAPRLDLSYLLFDFGERFASLRAAEEGLRSTNFQFNRTLQQVLFETQRRFFLFDAAQAALIASRQTIEEAQRSYEAAKSGFALGSRPKQDVLQAEAVLRRAEYDLENTTALQEEARAAFAEVLGVRVDSSLAIRSPDYSVFEKPSAHGNIAEVLDAALRSRPDLQAAYSDARAARARRDATERADLPKIVGTMSGTRNYLFEGERGIEDSYAVGVEVQIPIFTGFRNQSRIRQAEALAKSAYEEGRAKELSVAREVWASFFRFEAAQRQTRAATALLSAAQESYKAVETGYLNGANSVLDLLAAQRDLSDARKSLIAAQANCGIAFVELSLAGGTLEPPTQ